jgi:hypothetical protein
MFKHTIFIGPGLEVDVVIEVGIPIRYIYLDETKIRDRADFRKDLTSVCLRSGIRDDCSEQVVGFIHTIDRHASFDVGVVHDQQK